ERLRDPKFRGRLVKKFGNTMMFGGKKSVAEGIFYKALDLVGSRTKEDAVVIFRKALDNVKPSVEVRSRRVGGATYQVPVEVRPVRRMSLGMRWLPPFSASPRDKAMGEGLRPP